jgi:hypothetical protein
MLTVFIFMSSFTQLNHYHQSINVPTAGAKAFLMDIQGERAITYQAGLADWWVLKTVNAAGTDGLTCLPKHGGSRDYNFLITYLMTEQRCLTSAIARQSALTAGHRAPHS